MPLVLAESEVTGSGLMYEDRTGVSYQYPKRYRWMIQPGERFVYYRGRRKRGGGTAPQVYFGIGIIGRAEPDETRKDHYTCEILDYAAFPEPVFFKNPSGAYFETGAERRGFFQPGVRRISEEDFLRILEGAGEQNVGPSDLGHVPSDRSTAGPIYASQENLRAVEDFAVRVALNEARRLHPGAMVAPQPRNNPGFDILLRPAEEPDPFYIEVKGTSRERPQFFLTNGELQFSRRHAARFRLVVVYNIHLPSETYKLYWHEGAIGPDTCFLMRPVQWACELVRPEAKEGAVVVLPAPSA